MNNDKVNVKEKFFLTEADKHYPVWSKLLDHMKERLNEHRSKNDNPLSDVETSILRGQIKELKYLISLADDRKFM